MYLSISLNPQNAAALSGVVSQNLFGAIPLSTQGTTGGQNYDEHFQEAYRYLNLSYLRYPDGELPDGFAYQHSSGEWRFAHNGLNNGSNGTYFDPVTQSNRSTNFTVTQSYLDSLIPAFSLKYDELMHDGLLQHPGRMTFTESLALAVETGSSYGLVLPEFQYLRPEYSRQVYSNGNKELFRVDDHVHRTEINADITNFLTKLFVEGHWGAVPSNFTIEIGNEDFFGWNSNVAQPDGTRDLDSYSAYAISVLEAVHSFRQQHPGINFTVAMQAHGQNYVDEIARNFADAGATHLFGEIGEIDAMHVGLDVTVQSAANLEDNWTINTGAARLLDYIEANGGDRAAVELSMSAWSANSSDVSGFGLENHGLPAAGATLSLFSSLIEAGFESAANWGLGAWGGYGTNASRVDGGVIEYAPYIETYRLMAESLAGTTQIDTGMIDTGRTEPFQLYAYTDAAKAVLFASANDFTGTVNLNVQDFGSFGHVWLERVSTENGVSSIVTREQVAVNGTTLSFDFNQSYEVVRIIAAKTNPGHGELHLWGFEGGEKMSGSLSNDLLQGNGGNDTLFGGDGYDVLEGGSGNDYLYGNQLNDRLFGGDGNDLLHGGSGDDLLSGGAGADTFQFNIQRNNSVITDFVPGEDKVQLSGFIGANDTVQIEAPGQLLIGENAAQKTGTQMTVSLSDSSTGMIMEVRREGELYNDITLRFEGVTTEKFLANIEQSLDTGLTFDYARLDLSPQPVPRPDITGLETALENLPVLENASDLLAPSDSGNNPMPEEERLGCGFSGEVVKPANDLPEAAPTFIEDWIF